MGKKKGKNKYKPITILTIAYIRRNQNEAVYQTDCLCCSPVLQSRAAETSTEFWVLKT